MSINKTCDSVLPIHTSGVLNAVVLSLLTAIACIACPGRASMAIAEGAMRCVGARMSVTTEEQFPPGVNLYLTGVPAGTTLLGTTGLVRSSAERVSVDWGDGTADEIEYSSSMCVPSHTYIDPGDYTINIDGPTLTGVSAYSGSSYPVLSEKSGSGTKYLRSVVVGDSSGSIGIGNYCFYNCSGLCRVILSGRVTALGDKCFWNCSSLNSVRVPSSVTSFGTYCFGGHTSLKSAGPIGGGYDYEFGWTRSIPASAFSASGIATVDIPDSVESLGSSCFYACKSLRSVVVPDSVTSIGAWCFDSCSSLERVSLGSGICSIGNYCFRGCGSLSDIYIPDAVNTIGNYCFSDCSSLTNVVIPSSVTDLGSYCFYRCSSLADIVIPASIRYIGAWCFTGCSGVKTITSRSTTPPDLYERTFEGIREDIPVFVPEAAIPKYKNTAVWSSFTNYQPIQE